MFGFEGLGSIYWHMVSKLLLAVQENFFAALDNRRLPTALPPPVGELYYRIRAGHRLQQDAGGIRCISNRPLFAHAEDTAGAKQPGMTGQVKEEVLTRFGELGVRVAARRCAVSSRNCSERASS